jgi:Tol biopolymer transport system component
MLCATFRLTCYAALATALPASLAAGAQTRSSAPAVKSKTITISEGTDMAATVSPDHKTIIMDLQGLLYSMPMAGGKAKQISTPYEEDSHPVWSSKGGIVAIQSYAGGTFHIWTMFPDGTRRKQITTGHGDDREPSISPDGTTIAFASDRAFKGSYDIWTVNLATGALKQITSSDADEFEPAWSPDGTTIAFVSGTGIVGKSIESIHLASGKQNTIVSIDPATGRLEAPSFSPDGTKLSYIRYTGSGVILSSAQLVVTSATGDHEIVQTGQAQDAFPFPATWLSKTDLLYTGDADPFHRHDSIHPAPIPSQGLRLRLNRPSSGEGDLRSGAFTQWQTDRIRRAESALCDDHRQRSGRIDPRYLLQAGACMVTQRQDTRLCLRQERHRKYLFARHDKQ